MKFLGHMRKDSLEILTLTGNLDGKRGRGKLMSVEMDGKTWAGRDSQERR